MQQARERHLAELELSAEKFCGERVCMYRPKDSLLRHEFQELGLDCGWESRVIPNDLLEAPAYCLQAHALKRADHPRAAGWTFCGVARHTAPGGPTLSLRRCSPQAGNAIGLTRQPEQLRLPQRHEFRDLLQIFFIFFFSGHRV